MDIVILNYFLLKIHHPPNSLPWDYYTETQRIKYENVKNIWRRKSWSPYDEDVCTSIKRMFTRRNCAQKKPRILLRYSLLLYLLTSQDCESMDPYLLTSQECQSKDPFLLTSPECESTDSSKTPSFIFNLSRLWIDG